MKKTLILFLSLALALSLLASCGQPSANTLSETVPSDASQTPTPMPTDDFSNIPEDSGVRDEEQYLNTLIGGEPSSLDCARFLDIYSRTTLYSITEPLTRIENGIVTGAGAESWTVSDDGLIYKFALREN